MIDESAQRVPLYMYWPDPFISVYVSGSSSVIPMSVGREAVHAKTGILSDSEQLITATRPLRPNYGRFLPNSGFSID
jgi:hypothetical protein